MTTIALDAMGGDHAPRAEVEGAILAARELGVRVLLVGVEAAVRAGAGAAQGARNLPIEVVNATEVITMTDSPSHAFRRKKESSLHVAARLVRDGQADALVSAGNTGAVMTVARFVIGTLPSVDRPALAAAFPNMKEKISVILDVGANVDSKPAAHRAIRGDGRDLLPRDLGSAAAARRTAFHRRGRNEGQRADARKPSTRLKQLAAEFCGQRGGPRRVSRERGRDRLRRIHRQHRAEDQRRAGGAHRRNAEEGDQEQPDLEDRLRAFEARVRRFPQAHGLFRVRRRAAARGARHHGDRARALQCRTPIKNAIRVAAELCRSRVNEKIEQELSFAAAAVPARG